MVALAPPLQACLEIKLHIEGGRSVASAIKTYVQNHLEDSFAKELGLFLFKQQTGQGDHQHFKPHRQALVEILHKGLQGEPILQTLMELEEELVLASHEDLERHLQKLPFLGLVPLLLFQFPSIFILLVGPLLAHLLEALQF